MDTTSPHDYGTTATYECDPGYEITSGDKKRNCTESGLNSEGVWNGTMPTCSGIVVYAHCALGYRIIILVGANFITRLVYSSSRTARNSDIELIAKRIFSQF